MSTVFKNIDFSLDHLVASVDQGRIGLPDIQRPFVWKNAKVRDLFDSMYRGFPVGYLLFWENDAPTGTKQIGTDRKQVVPQYLIVDGQQRLTSLYAVVKGLPVLGDDFRQHRVRIAFRPRDTTFEVTTAFIEKDPEYIADISQLWAPSVSTYTFISRFIARLRDHREARGEPLDAAESERVADAIARLDLLKNYPFTALVIAPDVNAEQVSDIFVRVNSKGVPLNQADFILTLMSVHWDEGRKRLEAFCRAAREPAKNGEGPYNHFIEPSPDQLLRVAVALAFRRARLEHVYSVLRGKDMDTHVVSETRRQEQFGVLAEAQEYALNLQNWVEFLKAPLLAGYLGASMISSNNALVYAYAMYLIGRRDFGVEPFALRGVIARWYFMITLTARYSSSPESQMEMDLARFRSLTSADEFVAALDREIDATLTEDYWAITVPNALATSAARGPEIFAYYAALNLLSARVLFSQHSVAELLDPVTRGKRSALEKHHLFPQKHLRGIGYNDQKDINQIANLALVEWPDNASIGAKAPVEYFPAMVRKAVERHGFTTNDLTRMAFWHGLPQDWDTMNYQEFLDERRKGMARVIRAGYQRLRQKTGVGVPVPA